jgi:two-component system, sensor histidine kinase
MLPAFEIFAALARYRIDAISVGVAMLVACTWCRRHLQQRGAIGDFSRTAFPAIVGLLVVGALMAEWVTAILAASSVPIFPALLARAAVLGTFVLVSVILLIGSARMAILRAKLRTHANTERQLQSAKTVADEANRAKSDFLAVMSHEIRTPLNAVMGFASLLSETRLDEAQRNYLGTITSEGKRLSSLINDILDFTKIEEGRLLLERLPFAPVETVHEILRLLSARANEKNIDLRFEAQIAGPLLVAGDPLRFRQILLNLVDNAIKFTPRGAVTIFLHWTPPSRLDAQGSLSVRVRDTGIGIPETKLKTLFQMFVQADSSTTRRYGGTGLGLAICQRLVTLMGGKLSAKSEPGAGSEFAFTLPLTPVVLPADPVAPTPELAIKSTRPPRVLVVDDMETNRFLLEVFLRRNGFEPQLAAGGEEAIRLTREKQFDAILMDLQMPDMDGLTATKRIRDAEPPGRRTLIIALTASIGKGTREQCIEAGMDEHLTKPLDLRKFKAVLKDLIGAKMVASV